VLAHMLLQVPGYYVAYCGNIAFDATAAELEEVFADCGVTQVRSKHCCSLRASTDSEAAPRRSRHPQPSCRAEQ
jgi:hypothetical protein